MPGLAAMERLCHGISGGGVNLAPHRGPRREWAVARRRDLCGLIGLEFDRLTAAQQVYGPEVVRVGSVDEGAGRFGPGDAIRFVDGLLCNRPGVGLLLLSGDCPLVLVADPERGAIGVAHAGWRPLTAGICRWLVERMRVEFGSRPEDLHVGVGPCPCPQHYPVGPEVYRIAATRFDDPESLFVPDKGRRLMDLRAAVLSQLTSAGVPGERIELAGECTVADERFFSHRRDGAETGRFGLIGAIR